jgi:hypothetical protein
LPIPRSSARLADLGGDVLALSPADFGELNPVRRSASQSAGQVKGEKRATVPPRYCSKVIGRDRLVVEWFYDAASCSGCLAGYVRGRPHHATWPARRRGCSMRETETGKAPFIVAAGLLVGAAVWAFWLDPDACRREPQLQPQPYDTLLGLQLPCCGAITGSRDGTGNPSM